MSISNRNYQKMTDHAQKRAQQRGINEMQIMLIEMFGKYDLQKGGNCYAYMPDKVLIELRRAVDSLKGVALIKGERDHTVTVMHETRKTRRTLYAA